MTGSEILNLALGGIIIGYGLTPQLKKMAAILRQSSFRRSTRSKIDHLLVTLSRNDEARRQLAIKVGAELNHIKGQLQEALQEIRKSQSIAVPKDPLVAEINGDVKALFERLNGMTKQLNEAQASAEYVEAAIKAEADRNTAKLYSEGLAGLAKASSAVLERQAKIENLLEGLVNRLTQHG